MITSKENLRTSIDEILNHIRWLSKIAFDMSCQHAKEGNAVPKGLQDTFESLHEAARIIREETQSLVEHGND